MRFAVVGAGAIGAYVGAALHRGGSDVVLVARGAQLEALQRRGVEVRSPRGDFHAHPEATGDLEAVRDADVVFLGVKAHQLPELAPRLGPLLRPDAAVIGGQNGVPWWFFQSFGGPHAGHVLQSVDPGGAVSAAIPADQVIGCVPFPATELVEPGVVRHVEGTRFTIGEPGGGPSERCQQIAAAFVAGGLRCPVDEAIRNELWLKLIGNVAFNPLTALTGATLGELRLVPQTVELARAVLTEAAAVGEALGIGLRVSLERRLEGGLAVGDHRSSMLQDLEAGKPLEVDPLSGAVLEIAGLVGVDAPHTRAVDAAVRLRGLLAQRTPAGAPA
jgi:2-dehydropantoate 2-reductase